MIDRLRCLPFSNRSIMKVDLKLDFVPPWIINFMSRQLAGQGYKLFQKVIRAVLSSRIHQSRCFALFPP